MKNPFKKCSIAVTGDFGPSRSHEKMKQWIEAAGGTFAFKITTEVTHLVCSREHFKKSVTMVQQARKTKGLKIVTFDWLEDSLMRQSKKKEGDYLMKKQAKVAAKAKAKKKTIRKENVRKGIEAFEKSCEEFKSDMHAEGYHIYTDSTLFPYSITLARASLLANKNERYHLKVRPQSPSPTSSTPTIFPSLPPPKTARAFVHHPRAQRLQLYESHTPPFTYATYVKYSAPGACATHVLAPVGSGFETAMGGFRKFFRVKTRVGWEERGNLVGCGEEAFGYVDPGEGMPKGI